jgi:hypothetical protein
MHTTSSAATPTGGRIALALAAVYLIWGSTYLASVSRWKAASRRSCSAASASSSPAA